MNAAIGMMDKARARALLLDSNKQGSQWQFRAQMIGHCTTHDAAAVKVDDSSQIQKSLKGLDIGDVGEKDLIARDSIEFAGH